MTTAQEQQSEIQHSMYTNIYLLGIAHKNPKLYDGTRLLDHVRPDMFAKPNRLAFRHSIYFLLHTLNPTECKKSIPWPVWDNQGNVKFNAAVKVMLDSLKGRHEDAPDVPVLQTTHMITPGGDQFTRFMWKLSMLVLTEFLRNNAIEGDDGEMVLPLPMRSSDDSQQSKRILLNSEQLNKTMLHAVEEKYTRTIQELDAIKKESVALIEQIPVLNKEIEQLRFEQSQRNVLEVSSADFENEMEKIKTHMGKVQAYQDHLEECHQSINTLTNDRAKLVLEHDPETFEMPQQLQQSRDLPLMPFLELVDNTFKTYVRLINSIPIRPNINKLEEFHTSVSDNLTAIVSKIDAEQVTLDRMLLELRKRIDMNNTKLVAAAAATAQSGGGGNAQHMKDVFDATPELNIDVSSPGMSSSDRLSLAHPMDRREGRESIFRTIAKKSAAYRRNAPQSAVKEREPMRRPLAQFLRRKTVLPSAVGIANVAKTESFDGRADAGGDQEVAGAAPVAGESQKDVGGGDTKASPRPVFTVREKLGSNSSPGTLLGEGPGGFQYNLSRETVELLESDDEKELTQPLFTFDFNPLENTPE